MQFYLDKSQSSYVCLHISKLPWLTFFSNENVFYLFEILFRVQRLSVNMYILHLMFMATILVSRCYVCYVLMHKSHYFWWPFEFRIQFFRMPSEELAKKVKNREEKHCHCFIYVRFFVSHWFSMSNYLAQWHCVVEFAFNGIEMVWKWTTTRTFCYLTHK